MDSPISEKEPEIIVNDESLLQEDLEIEENNSAKKYKKSWQSDYKKAYEYLSNGDYTEAYKEFCKINEKNPNAKILYRLGIMTVKGMGCEADFDAGIKMIRQSAELGSEYAQQFLEQRKKYNQSKVQNAAMSMLFSFAKLISDDYNRGARGQKLRTEHKLKSAIRRKKLALGLKENPLENPQFKE